MKQRRRSLLGLVLACAASGCEQAAGAPPAGLRAEFGVFYGGQIQQRQELPLVLDRTRQLQGFRLQRSPPAAEPLQVRWELSQPGKGRRVPSRRGLEVARRVQSGQAEWRSGEIAFERALPFAAGDSPGLWNVRVSCGEQVVLDRPFVVFDERERARRALVEADAGAP